MEHFIKVLKVPLMQGQKSITHLAQSQNCVGIVPVLDAGAGLRFSLRGLLLVNTKNLVLP